MKAPTKKVGKLVSKAQEIALKYVEKEARRILRRDKNLLEFVMSMGCCTFTVSLPSSDKTDVIGIEDVQAAAELNAFIDDWDDILRLTGVSMRFTATGPVVESW